MQAAYEAYDNLTDEQKAQVTGAEFRGSSFAVFDSITDVSENTGDFIVTGDASGYSYDAETHVLTVNDGADITISGTTTQDHIVVADSAAAAITLNGADIQFSDGSASYGSADETDAGNACALSVENNASLILNLSGEKTPKSGAGRAGIHVAENASLTIRGDGKLTVTGGNCAAGICGGLWNNAGNITIEGERYKVHWRQ